MATVLSVHRPLVGNVTGGSATADAVQLANYIRAEVDLDNDGRRRAVLTIQEADHAGVIAEYEAGSATTLLEAALDTEVAALSDVDELSSTQKTNLIGKAVTFPSP